MAKKIALTPAAIDVLQEGGLADLLTPSLSIPVLKSGRKRWPFRRRIAGTDVVATLFGGLIPERTVTLWGGDGDFGKA